MRRQVSYQVALMCLTLLGCGEPEGDEATPTATPVPTPVPTPLASVCDWDGLTGVTPSDDDWWQSGVVYEIFVRSFQDGGCEESCGGGCDGMGDLSGLISRLDYLNDGNPDTDTDLGVTTLWLMPVFEGASDHCYDTLDYYSIEKDYGTQQDFEKLLAEAHARGIKVILDLAFNHTAKTHPWFEDSASDAASSRRDWYRWSDASQGGGWYELEGSYYYAALYDSIPDLNYRSAEVRDEMTRIWDHWLGQGVDGFRLDAVKFLLEDGDTRENAESTHCYLQGMRRYFDTHWPDRMLVGEVYVNLTDQIAPYFGDGTNELPLAFDFPLSEGIIKGVATQDSSRLAVPLTYREVSFPHAWMGAPFLRNHDQDRTGSLLTTQAQLKQAVAIQFALAGTPFIYYGEELGMTGLRTSPWHDLERRTPMQWTGEANAGFTACTPWNPVNADYTTLNVAAQTGDPDSLLSFYRRLIRLRLAPENAILQKGSLTVVNVTQAGDSSQKVPGGYAWLRGTGDGAILVVLNLTEAPLTDVAVNLSDKGPWAQGFELLEERSLAGPVEGNFPLGTLPANAAWWVRLSQGTGRAQR